MQNIFGKLAVAAIAIGFTMTSAQAGDDYQGGTVVEEAPVVEQTYTRRARSSCFSRSRCKISRPVHVRPAPVYVPRPAPVRRASHCRLFSACAVRRRPTRVYAPRPARVYVPRPAPVYVRPTRSRCTAYRHHSCSVR